jgi:DeoR family fructose operon transcriptional repressor
MTVRGTLDSEQRMAALREDLERSGALLLNDTARTWGVHPMTIRRDFERLERAGLARRVRGGIISSAGEGFEARANRFLGAKKTIARKLAPLVVDQAAIGMDASTTVFRLIEGLHGASGLSVITNGINAFEALHAVPGVRAFITGGEREEHNVSLVGTLAVKALAQFNLDRCFLSCAAVDPETGSSETTIEQAAIKEAMSAAASEVVLAVSSDKLGSRSRVRSLPLNQIDVLVTELEPTDPRLDPYRDSVSLIL